MDAGALVVDIRPIEFRRSEGEISGAVVMERNVLEWRLDPTSDARSLDVYEGQRIILFCNDGYASSLAAVGLHELGLTGATDLIGGYRAYRRYDPAGTTAPEREVVEESYLSFD
jgi:rhodanese-related sulfurtransferase